MGGVSDYPDIFGIDIHTHGKETFQFDKQTLDLGAAGGHQAALVSVERAADDADFASVHGRSDFFRQVILGEFRSVHGIDEPLHVRIGDGHRFAPGIAQPAVLEGRRLFHDGIESALRLVDKEQILYERDLLADMNAFAYLQAPFHRDEDFHLHFFKLLVGGLPGVHPFQVAHHIPP